MRLRLCLWDYCSETIPETMRRCPEHRNMKWWEEYEEHVKHLCWEEEEIPLEDFGDAISIVYDSREAGGPKRAALQLESEHGINPAIFGPRFDGADSE